MRGIFVSFALFLQNKIDFLRQVHCCGYVEISIGCANKIVENFRKRRRMIVKIVDAIISIRTRALLNLPSHIFFF